MFVADEIESRIRKLLEASRSTLPKELQLTVGWGETDHANNEQESHQDSRVYPSLEVFANTFGPAALRTATGPGSVSFILQDNSENKAEEFLSLSHITWKTLASHITGETIGKPFNSITWTMERGLDANARTMEWTMSYRSTEVPLIDC